MKKTNYWILLILFIVCVVLSLLLPYLIMSSGKIIWFINLYLVFSIIILPILTIWLGLLLSKGKWLEIKNHISILVVFVAVLLVASFCIFKWTNAVNTYGIYGHYIKNAEFSGGASKLYPTDNKTTRFENETLYRELMNSRYDLEYKKMWTFSAFVFISAFLLLYAISPKEKK